MGINIEKRLKQIYFNLLKLKSRIFNGPPVLVLMYHKINDEVGKNLRHLTVSTEAFEEQLIFFKKKYNILSFNESWTRLKKTSIVLTFDDGYADNFLNALPLLKKHQIPAIFFITTKNINTANEFWWDRLDKIFESLESDYFLPNKKNKVNIKCYSYRDVANNIKKLSEEERQVWFDEFEKLNAIKFKNRESYRSLSKKEIVELLDNPLITIGMHTHNHFNFADLKEIDQDKELKLSKQIFEKYIPKQNNLFAFPHGGYSSQSFEILKKHGFKYLFLANDQYSNNSQKQKGLISRILITNITGRKLKDRLSRFH